MPLTRATSIQVERAGFWFFAEWHVTTSDGASFRVPSRRLRDTSPVRAGEQGARTLWHVDGEWYWDTDGLTAEEVELTLWDRDRKREARFERLRKVRAREEDLASARRERIPDEVRAFVWHRDDGRCTQCGAEDDLQFDHVIPVAKGGGNAPENIQVLCGDCNRAKSDSIV
ncbi:MAG: hypothetical protein GEU80_13805 [Dehalococcoidia bacterium]|nr:hypothetical protein [Dehalococcoidia bacterium]